MRPAAVILDFDPMWVSALILVATYAAIISEKVNRAIVALIGGVATIVVGLLDQEEAVAGIDWNTIGLLTGMMILVAVSQRSGIFQYVAIRAARLARANPAGILLLLQLATAILSALLDNVTTVLLMIPVTLSIARQLGVAPYPFLFAEIFASNIGGAATLIGDPPNIIIGSQAGLGFNEFVINLAPVIVVVVAVQTLMIHLIWGKDMGASREARAAVMEMNPGAALRDRVLLRQAAAVLALVTLGFILARPLHLQPATIAIGGAALMLLFSTWRQPPEKASHSIHATFGEVEWITIFFFVGLFVVVGGVEASGLLDVLGRQLVGATAGDLPTAGYVILWSSAVASAVVDNIPFVATMIPLVKSTAPAFGGAGAIEPLWWCLSLGANLGGNATLVGASANLMVAGLAERNGVQFRFGRYMLYAVPLTLVSIAIGQAYVWWRYF